MSQPVPACAELLDGARHSVLHLQMRDAYGVSTEAADFARWKTTGERDLDPASAYWSPWVALVRRSVARGVRVARVRIVSEPVSEYTRYEYAGTVVGLTAGEEIRWLPRRDVDAVPLPGNDFWLVDDRVVRWDHYTGEGASAGGETSDDPAAVRLCSTAFAALWVRAVPHDLYRIH